MKFILTNVKDFEKKIDVTVPFKEFITTQKKEILHIRKKTTINGFRKNKIPIEIIQKKYEVQIKKNTIQKIIYNNLKEIIKTEELHIISEPKITVHQYKKNVDFTYSIYLQCLPKINLSHLKEKKIQKTSIIVDNKDIKDYIDNMRKKQIIWEKNNNKIKKKDKVTIYYCIKEKNEFKKYQVKKITFSINKKVIIPEIEKQILQKKTQDTILVTIQIPPKHPDLNYKKKTLTIKVKIEKTLNAKMKYSYDQFIQILKQTFQVNRSTDVKTIIKKQLNKNILHIEYDHLKQQIMYFLAESNVIQIPEKLFSKEYAIIQKKIQKEYIKEKGNILQKKYHQNFKKDILNKIKIELIIKSIIYRNHIHVTQDEIKEYLEYEKKNNHEFIKMLKIQKNKTKIYDYIHNIILEKKVINYLTHFFTIIHKTKNLRKIKKNTHII